MPEDGGQIRTQTGAVAADAFMRGLDVVRYSAESLHSEFGGHFLLESSEELHQTPFGTVQQFLYCHCRVE